MRNEKKASIIIVDNSHYLTGALKSIINFSVYAKDSYNFIFILPEKSKAEIYIKEHGFEVLFLPFIEINKHWKNLILYIPRLFSNGYKLKKLTRRRNISLVHINDFYNLTGILAKVIGGNFKLVTHVRFMPNRFPSILVNVWIYLNIKFSNRIIAVSQAVKMELPNSPKVHQIYDGPVRYSPLKNRIEKKQNNHIKLLYVAHFIPGKGQDLALEAFCKAYRENKELRLRFVGGDMGLVKNIIFKRQLRSKVRSLGLEEVVEFEGFKTTVEKEMASADIALNFSESESFSMTCLEALSNGVALIASDCGGPRELFEHNISGLLVANKDINVMCDAILHLAEDKEKRLKFGKNSVKYVRDKFAAKKTVRKSLQLYNSLLTKICEK